MNQRIFVKRTKNKGSGIFAKKPFKKDSVVVRGKPEAIVDHRTDYSFQIDINKHVQLDKPARLINHSCEPNLGIKNNQFGGYDFIALRNIVLKEELTWDYCTTEFVSIAIGNKCLCKKNSCRKKITGFVCLPEDIKNTYNDFIADYLKKL